MILGIGIDMVQINRISAWADQPRLLDRYFHPAELEAVREKGPQAILSLAARFAAKEAFGKAAGTGLRGFALREVQVRNAPGGRPELLLHGNAQQLFRAIGACNVHLSLSHEKENAVAMVVIEGNDGR